MIYKLIWRNLWRNSRRTWITTASIVFSVFLTILMQSFQKGTFDHLINSVVGYYSGFIQVHQRGYWEEKVLDNCFVTNDSIRNAILSVPGVKGVVPRLESFLLASMENVTKGCMLVGTDPIAEDNLTQLKSKLVAGDYFQPGEESILIAEGLAERLHVGVGDTLVLFGQGYQGTLAAGKFRIKGIVHFASPPINNNMAYLPVSAAQYLLSAEDRLTSYALLIDDPSRMNEVSDQLALKLGDAFEVMTWEELMPDMSSHIKADTNTSYIYTAILYLIIGFGLFGTILMMTAERRYEFGMLIAIGMKKMRLGLVLLGEIFLITILAVIIGIGISYPFVVYFNRHPIRFGGGFAEAFEKFGFDALMPTAIHLPIFFTQALIVFAMALVIGMYPIVHLRGIDPVKAMKH